jgi:hypothetical protein
MIQIGLSAQSHLPLMDSCGKDISLFHEVNIGLWIAS